MSTDIFSILWLLIKPSCIDLGFLAILLFGAYLYIKLINPTQHKTTCSSLGKTMVCLIGGYGVSLLLTTFYIIHNLGWSIEPDILQSYILSQNPISMLLLRIHPVLGLLIGVVAALLITGEKWRSIGLCNSTIGLWKTSAIALVGLLTILIISYFYNVIVNPESETVILRSQLNMNLGYNLKYFHLVFLVLLAPVVEELFFRGVLHNFLESSIGFKGALFLQATLYASMHNSVEMFLPYFIFGIVTGYSRYLSKSLIPAIFIHTVYSGVNTIDLWSIF